MAKEKERSGVYDVRAFGATGDGKALDTPAINRAIESAAAAGGGTVRFIDTNRDGIDIDACRNVRISNCSVNSPFEGCTCPYRCGPNHHAGAPYSIYTQHNQLTKDDRSVLISACSF